MSSLIIAITSLPSDVTLLSLEPVVLFEIVCVAMFRHQSAIWLNLAAMLVHQLDPPSLSSLLSDPDDRSRRTVLMGLPIIYDATFKSLRAPGDMEAVRPLIQIWIYLFYADVYLISEPRCCAGILRVYGDGGPTFHGYYVQHAFERDERSDGLHHKVFESTRAVFARFSLQVPGMLLQRNTKIILILMDFTRYI